MSTNMRVAAESSEGMDKFETITEVLNKTYREYIHLPPTTCTRALQGIMRARTLGHYSSSLNKSSHLINWYRSASSTISSIESKLFAPILYPTKIVSASSLKSGQSSYEK